MRCGRHILRISVLNLQPMMSDCKSALSPKRKAFCDKAYEAQLKQAKIMKKGAFKIHGKITVGDVVQFGLHKSDQTKVDPNHITADVVEVTKGGQLRLAVAEGVLKNTCDRGNVTVLKPLSNYRVLLGLEDAFKEWQGMSRIIVIELQQGPFLFVEGSGKMYSAIAIINVIQIVASVRRSKYFAVTCCINHE